MVEGCTVVLQGKESRCHGRGSGVPWGTGNRNYEGGGGRRMEAMVGGQGLDILQERGNRCHGRGSGYRGR